MKLLKTLTNKRKTKILRATAIIMTIASAIFLVTTSVWKAKTGFYIDDMRTTSFNTNATVAVASAAVAMVTTPIALLLAYKNKQLAPLLLLVFSALVLLLAFIMPLKDQKAFAEDMDLRYAANDMFTNSTGQEYFEWAQKSFTKGFWHIEAFAMYPVDPVTHASDAHNLTGIVAMPSYDVLVNHTGLTAQNEIDGAEATLKTLNEFTATMKLLTHHGLVSAKASLHTANIAVLWTGVGLVALAFFLNYYKAVDARTVTIQMPVKETKAKTTKAPAKKAPAKKATKAKK